MALLRRSPPDRWAKSDAERIRRLAETQQGVVSRQQLAAAGFSDGAISRWLETGRLHRVFPHVYALGHSALSLEGRLFAALLYGGQGAVLSHTTAAWLWELVDAEPTRIHLTVPGRRSSLPEVRLHRTRRLDRTMYRGLPLTPVGRTLLDLGSMLTARQLRRALAEADFRGRLDQAEIQSLLGKGRPGAAALRAALERHLPQLARTFSELENRFIELCHSSGVSPPEVNAKVDGMRVDALWRGHHLAVELDGVPAHGGAAAMKRDRRRELALRSAGFQVVRYTWEQVARQPDLVIGDLRRLLELGARPRAGLR